MLRMPAMNSWTQSPSYFLCGRFADHVTKTKRRLWDENVMDLKWE